jgi:hypothetical protein
MAQNLLPETYQAINTLYTEFKNIDIQSKSSGHTKLTILHCPSTAIGKLSQFKYDTTKLYKAANDILNDITYYDVNITIATPGADFDVYITSCSKKMSKRLYLSLHNGSTFEFERSYPGFVM